MRNSVVGQLTDPLPVHESDLHLRTEQSESVRLPHGVAEALRAAETEAFGMDALELSRDAGATRYTGSRVIYDESCLAEKDRLRLA